jgi:hypothetical protein
MRYVLLLAFLAMSSPSFAETLLSEATATYTRGGLFALPTILAYRFSVNATPIVSRSFAGGEPFIGVPQGDLIPEDSPLNLHYQLNDLINPSSGLGNHLFLWQAQNGQIYESGFPDERLFVTGVYNARPPTSDGFQVTSYYTPPNGNSFLGTSARFTRIEFVVNSQTVGTVVPDVPWTLGFTVRFFGEIPEPSSAFLFALGLTAFAHRYRRPSPGCGAPG